MVIERKHKVVFAVWAVVMLCILAVMVMAILSLFDVAYAAGVDSPDTFTIDRVEVYQDCLETGDQLYLILHNIDYSSNPTEGTASDLFLFRLMNGSVELGSNVCFAYYDEGYDYGLASIYFSAAQVSALGMGFGAATGYTAKIEGNPMYTWDAGTPPSVATSSFDLWYDSGETEERLTLRMRVIAQLIENEWSVDLIEGEGGDRTLTDYGVEYFTNTILNLKLMCPELFSARLGMADWDERDVWTDYFTGGDDSVTAITPGSPIGQTYTPSGRYTLDRLEFRFIRVGTPSDVTITVYPASGTPNGAAVASGTISAADLSDYEFGEWVEVSLGTGCTVTPGSQMAFTASISSGTVHWRTDTDSRYAGGSLIRSNDNGATWATGSGDLMFLCKAYGDYTAAESAKQQGLLLGTPFDFTDLAESLDVELVWFNFLFWQFVTITGICLLMYTNNGNPKPAIFTLFFMQIIGGIIGFITYMALAAILFVAALGIVAVIGWRHANA